MSENRKLTVKQKKFADEYIISGNATEAAIKAGYSENTARVIGSENLTKPYIKSYIDERMKEIEDGKIATQEEVLQYLTRVMRGEETEKVLRYTDMGYQELVDKYPSISDKTKAAELIGKRYSLFTDRQEVEADMNLNIEIDYGEEES